MTGSRAFFCSCIKFGGANGCGRPAADADGLLKADEEISPV